MHEETIIRVTNELYAGHIEVRFEMGNDGRVTTTTDQANVVIQAELLPDEMAVFWFKEDGDGLSLNVFSGIPVVQKNDYMW